MIPQQGQQVRCILRSSMILEGIVEEWTPEIVILKSFNDHSLIILHYPKEDLMMTKIILKPEETISQVSEEHTALPPQHHSKENSEQRVEIREKLHETIQSTNDNDLDQLNLQQLRQLVIEQEKQIIAQKKREYFGSIEAPKPKSYASSMQILSRQRKK